VYDRGQRAAGPSIVVFALSNGLSWSRLGLTVSRKFGGAVDRNLMKRRIREIFRNRRGSLPAGLDLVVNVRQGSGSTPFERLDAEFCDQVRAVARRCLP
jgi:ribonuclease P protein component